MRWIGWFLVESIVIIIHWIKHVIPISPFRILFELFVSPAASPTPTNAETQNKKEGGGHTYQAANKSFFGYFFSHSHVSFVDLCTMFILKSQNIVS